METLKDILGLPAWASESDVRNAAKEAVSAWDWVMSNERRAQLFCVDRPFGFQPTPGGRAALAARVVAPGEKL